MLVVMELEGLPEDTIANLWVIRFTLARNLKDNRQLIIIILVHLTSYHVSCISRYQKQCNVCSLLSKFFKCLQALLSSSLFTIAEFSGCDVIVLLFARFFVVFASDASQQKPCILYYTTKKN